MPTRPHISCIVPSAVLGGLAGLSFLAPEPLGIETTLASMPPTARLSLPVVVRDFRGADEVLLDRASFAHGQFANNVAPTLTAGGVPQFAPGGFQVLSQWRDASRRPIAPSTARTEGGPTAGACGVIADLAGTAGPPGAGGIPSAEAFDSWFRDVPGVNRRVETAIELRPNGEDWEFFDDDFQPIDCGGADREGDAPDAHFTLELSATFTYRACSGQYVEFTGGDGFWLFVNGRLVMDLGGVGGGSGQFLDLDRFDLADGASCAMRLFYAQRGSNRSMFRVRTNIDLAPAPAAPVASASE